MIFENNPSTSDVRNQPHCLPNPGPIRSDFSDSFADANDLLAECARRGLDGIVCKRKDAPYGSGPPSGWIKVKTQQWKAANRYRAKLFEKQRR